MTDVKRPKFEPFWATVKQNKPEGMSVSDWLDTGTVTDGIWRLCGRRDIEGVLHGETSPIRSVVRGTMFYFVPVNTTTSSLRADYAREDYIMDYGTVYIDVSVLCIQYAVKHNIPIAEVERWLVSRGKTKLSLEDFLNQ